MWDAKGLKSHKNNVCRCFSMHSIPRGSHWNANIGPFPMEQGTFYIAWITKAKGSLIVSMEITILCKTLLKLIPFNAPGKELSLAKHPCHTKPEGRASRQRRFWAVSGSEEHSSGTSVAITCPELAEEMRTPGSTGGGAVTGITALRRKKNLLFVIKAVSENWVCMYVYLKHKAGTWMRLCWSHFSPFKSPVTK